MTSRTGSNDCAPESAVAWTLCDFQEFFLYKCSFFLYKFGNLQILEYICNPKMDTNSLI